MSSLSWYLAAPEHRPHWIRVDRLLGEHGLPQATPAARQEFERRLIGLLQPPRWIERPRAGGKS